MISNALYSSASMEWETPEELFRTLDAEFHFTLDTASTDRNAKCRKHFTKAEDGLRQSWKTEGAAWCNPPYGREVGNWSRKAFDESRGGADSCNVTPCSYRHEMVSRLYQRKGRGAFYSRPFAVYGRRRAEKEPRAVSLNDCDMEG